MTVLEDKRFFGKASQVRRDDLLIAVGRQVVGAQGIGNDADDVQDNFLFS